MNKKPSLLLIGAGGHALSCIDVIEQHNVYQVGGIIGYANQIGEKRCGYTVLGSDESLIDLIEKFNGVLISIGQIKTPAPRIKYYELLKQSNCSFPTVVSSKAYVSSHAQIGEGTVVMHGAIINAGAVIGKNCIINSHSLIEHGATIEDHCHIATSSVINGDVLVGEGTFIGSGSLLKQGINIGRYCVIGMGKIVLQDCNDRTWLI